MPQLSFFRILLILIICVSALLFASPNFFYSMVDKKLNNPTQTSAWPNFMPLTLVKLGLDLRGGVYMLLEVKTDDVVKEKFDFLWSDIRKSLVKKRTELGSIRRTDSPSDQLKIQIENQEGISFAIKEIEEFNSSRNYFLQGGQDL